MQLRNHWPNLGLIIVSLLLSTSCAPISQTSEITQPVGQTLQAGVGDTVLTIDQRESMPNAFGNADVFGRTRPTGMITVQFMGLDGSLAKFVRNGITIDSGMNTMNSTPLVLQNSTTVNSPAGIITTYGAPTVVPATPPPQNVVPQMSVALEIDLTKVRVLPVAGRVVEVIDATPTSLTYRIR